MIGKQGHITEQIYDRLKHLIDDVYRSKGMSSESIKKYFSHRKNFKILLDKLKDLETTYGEQEKSFSDLSRDILDKILLDRIYYERDNPTNESYVLKYNYFLNEFNLYTR